MIINTNILEYRNNCILCNNYCMDYTNHILYECKQNKFKINKININTSYNNDNDYNMDNYTNNYHYFNNLKSTQNIINQSLDQLSRKLENGEKHNNNTS